MSNALSHVTSALRAVHEQEEGMEVLQTVMIVAFAAIVLAFAYKIFGGTTSNSGVGSESIGGEVGKNIGEWVEKKLKNLFSFD